ncbi:molybdopterin molybdotransferase MoeA [Halorhabdus amylolytica]|uniref:molybdopterin molybdotransferase MoeA n=1 Tax=Halorhabdus amylolytica TaxID=2559573 RepID=UPI0010A9A699|nr:gephyrin-like molybdotransferase Glp [Halorhabdus amylolytica]
MTHDHATGFGSVTRLADAREKLLSVVEPHGPTGRVEAADALGRVLSGTVDAERPVPHFERAAMDGYAVRAADTHGASERSPRRLDPTTDDIASGEAVRINTGQPLPEGADAVVMIEDITERDGVIDVTSALAPGENVSPVGEDVPEGRRLFDPGRRLDPADIALLRATGVGSVVVRDPPTVGVIPTGEELVEGDPDRGEIVETNGTMVAGLLEQWGGQASKGGIVTDDFDRLADAIRTAAETDDLVVTTGGSSVGDRDLLPDVLESVGELYVHGVAIKPGHPLGFGVVGGTPILALPGYPVSCIVGATQLLRPAIARAGEFEPAPIHTREAELTGKIASEPGVRTFVRVVDAGEGRVEPLRVAGASVLSSITDADGWVVVPESVEGYSAGETVTIEAWRWTD